MASLLRRTTIHSSRERVDFLFATTVIARSWTIKLKFKVSPRDIKLNATPDGAGPSTSPWRSSRFLSHPPPPFFVWGTFHSQVAAVPCVILFSACTSGSSVPPFTGDYGRPERHFTSTHVTLRLRLLCVMYYEHCVLVVCIGNGPVSYKVHQLGKHAERGVSRWTMKYETHSPQKMKTCMMWMSAGGRPVDEGGIK